MRYLAVRLLRAALPCFLLTGALLGAACGGGGSGKELPLPEPSLRVSSTAFEAGGPIPIQFTCDGADASPPLSWEAGPPGTVMYALVVDDPDAPRGIFVHWAVWGLPPNTTSLPAAASKSGTLPAAVREGKNDFGRQGWGGPCPPKGDEPHRYRFRVYALREPIALPAGAAPRAVLDALEGTVLAWGELVGTYGR
ncbi:MAG: YbhB/YbcL family Raf kinase inhibitor-like protein [Chloroflexota bacterium]|nr:YbhB/YbcL family Raf kinase inhibitor-like protein [Dehalococcoidia bacterium]MDW8046869.1 YbhB/YbcL family Raf kinase inhibitor-like protein [Chloroflexota bacterium]